MLFRSLRSELDRLETDRKALIAQRDEVRQQIAERDRDVQRQNHIISQGRARLSDLEAQQRFLDGEILKLEQDLVLLRERRVAGIEVAGRSASEPQAD